MHPGSLEQETTQGPLEVTDATHHAYLACQRLLNAVSLMRLCHVRRDHGMYFLLASYVKFLSPEAKSSMRTANEAFTTCSRVATAKASFCAKHFNHPLNTRIGEQT